MEIATLMVVIGAALTVGAILVTMIWTLREMYVHEARFADANFFASVASASAAIRPEAREALLEEGCEWYRVSNEFMLVSGRHSEAARLLFVSEFLLAGSLLTLAVGSDSALALSVAGSLVAASAFLFALGLAAVYDVLGTLRHPGLRSIYRAISRVFVGLLPFLATPWPNHWPEVEKLMKEVPELADFAEHPFDTLPLAESVLTRINSRLDAAPPASSSLRFSFRVGRFELALFESGSSVSSRH